MGRFLDTLSFSGWRLSQVGYLVAAVGMGAALALNGSGAHAFCHILYKALLFISAGDERPRPPRSRDATNRKPTAP